MHSKQPNFGPVSYWVYAKYWCSFFFLSLLFLSSASAQVLDVLPPASAAYSLRLLKTSYTTPSPAYPTVAGSSYVPVTVNGPAIRVRRTSDDALQDIGFNPTGDLNTTALLDFIGGTNLFTYSEQFNNTSVWSGVGSVITANATAAPNTSLTADNFNEDATNNEHFVDYNYTSPAANTTYSMSVYVKPIDNTDRLFIIRGVFADGTSSSYMSFNLNTGTFVSSIGGRWNNPSITPMAGGWFLLRGSYVTPAAIPAATDLVFRLQYMVDNPLANVYPGNTAISTALWGAQLQQGTVFLGYTPTVALPQRVIPTGYVHTWFDQTGNARHVTQVNQDNQPMIVDTGIVVRGPNGKVTVYFWGDRSYTASSFLANGSSSINATNSTINMVTRWLSLSGVSNQDLPFGIGTTNDTRRGRFFYRSGNNMVGWSAWGCDVTGTVINPDPGGAIHTYNAVQNGTALTMAKDGMEYNFTLPNLPLTPSTGVSIGQLYNPTQTNNYFTEMEFSEGIVFASALTPAERRILQCDQGTYYVSPTTISGIDFYVGAVVDQTACKFSSEQVVWNSATVANATISGTTLTKINTIGWDGGAASLNTVSNNGYMEFRAIETNKGRMIGLSSTIAGINYTNLQFAIYLRSNGTVDVYESGVSRGPGGSFGSFATNDLFRVAIESGTIRYYKNGVLFYTSPVAPVTPMYAHVSMSDIGATASQVTVFNPCSGTFMANASNTGPNPIYQWQVNGVNVGTNSNTYSNPGLGPTSVVTCSITLDGCASNAVTSNAVSLINGTPNPSLRFYIRSATDTAGCTINSEQIAWRFISLDNIPLVQTTPTSITKLVGASWDAGSASLNPVNNNGYFQFTATLTTKALMGGLSSTISGVNYTNIQYAIYLANNGSLQIYESGTNKGSFGNYNVGDVLRVAIEGGRVNYYRNNVLFYSSLIAPSLPMYAHVSIADVGGSLTSMSICNRSSRSFIATVLNGPSAVNYQWTVNGAAVQTGPASTYSNPSLAINDVVACNLQLTGCFTNTYPSNTITLQNASPSPGIAFYIAGIPDPTSCRKAGEQVAWKYTALSNQDRLTLAANTATKRLSNGWDAVAVSYNVVYNNGYLEFKALETNKARMIGLSNTYTNSSYTTVQFGIYLQNNATIGIYESGINRGTFGSYATNDTFRVAVDNNIVRYYKNGQLFYTSTVVPVLPMMAQAALNEIGATAYDLYVWNLNNGAFAAYPINTTTPLNFTWKTNGAANGGTAITYSNASLTNGSILTCDLSFQQCFSNVIGSNQIIIAPTSPNPSLVFYIQGVSDSTACWLAGEQAVWSFTSLTDQQRLSISPTLVTKTNSVGWDAALYSYNQVTEGGYLEFRVAEINKARIIGLSSTYSGSGSGNIQYGMYLQNNGSLSITEAGVNRGTFSTYTVNDTLRIAVEQGKVRYYRNRILFYTSNTAPVLPLRAHATFYDVGATLLEPVIWNPNRGYFNAVVINGPATMNYGWKLNGIASGTNSTQYINTTMVAGDILNCDLQLTGCLSSVFTSNVIRRRALAPNPALSFFIRGEVEQNSCRMAGEEVVWNNFTSFQDLDRVIRNRNNLSKILSAGWDGGAASLNRVYNNGYVEFKASETNKARMLGLSASYTTSSYTGIQYAFYLQSNGALGVFESGTNRGNFGTYVTGDMLRIHVQLGTVKYYKNGVLLYTSTVSPSLPMLVDASLNDISATLTEVMVYNYNNGDFVAIAQQAGNDLTYTWMVNGVVVQSGRTSSYSNIGLVVGDIVTCQLSQGGCLLGNNYLSNQIFIIAAPQLTPDFFIEGQRVFPSCSMAIEQVMWSNSDMTSNMSAVNINSLVKTTGNGLWNGGAASLNKVKNRGYFEFTATENNKLRAVGLTTVNNGADQNTINYCFYLQNDGFYRIYESGTDRGLIGAYAPGSVFRIGIDNTIVKYYKDGALVYISTVAPALPIMADVSINEAGGTVTNAFIANYNAGTFVANIQNGGTYTWMINGAIIQTNLQNTFTPASLQYNDTVTCILNSNLPGCTPQVLYSNFIVYRPAPTDSVDFFIGPTGASSGCQFAVEQVKWKLSEISQATMWLRPDHSLIKLQSSALWNGGAASWSRVFNNGYLEFVATENNKARAIGLSNTYADASLASIQFAVVLQSNGTFRVYESNVDRGAFGNYVPGDVFRIWIDNSTVRYYRNNVLYYVSFIIPALPLYVDVSVYDIGGTIGKAEVGNYTNGTLQAYSVNAGSGATYAWTVNGNSVQTGVATSYTNSNLQRNDTVRCTLTSGVPGCTPYPYGSNYVFMNNTLPPLSDFAITSEPATATCALVTEPVRWKLSDLSRDASVVNGNGLIRNQNAGWNCGAFSWNKVHNNGYLEFKVLETNKYRMIGLSSINLNADWTSLQYAIYLTSSATFDIRQSGNTIAIANATYAANDVFRIAVESNVVKYYKNGNLIYVSAVVPALPLMVDVSIYDQGGTVNNAVITNFSSGNFTANTVNMGSGLTYSWSVNGAVTQTGPSNTYANLNLQNNDTIRCVATSTLSGCNLSPANSNIIINTITAVTNIDFAIRGVAVPASCSVVREDVKWKKSELTTNMSISNVNQLTKTGTSNAWDGGAASWNTVSNNGYFEFIALETNKNRMIGLSTTNTGSDQSSIRYAFLLESNATYRVYESGTYKGVLGAYATGDTFRISVESNVVRYLKSGVAVYSSLIVPTLPLLVDVSFLDPGATVKSPTVVNFNGGQFEALTLNAGSSPSYQWFVNNVSVQTGPSATYTNTSLNNNDIVRSEMTANLAGCISNAPLISNDVKNVITVPVNVDAYVKGVPVASSCQVLYEEIQWKTIDLTNVVATSNNLIKTMSDGSWDGGAGSWNTVSMNGGFQFTVTENDKARMAGLSATNANSNYTSIGFAFHLLATGELRIVEGGVDRNYSGAYLPNDILRMSVELVAGQNRVRYYKNNLLIFTSVSIASTLPMMADISIFNQGGTITNAIIYNPHAGGYVAGATNAGSPNFEWKVNGVTVQNGPNGNYTNNGLAHNDVVTCLITPGLNGCSGITFPSNRTILKSPTLVINPPAPVCSPGTVDLTLPAVTAGTPPDMTITYWTDPAGTVALANPRDVPAGTYYIKATRFTTCVDIRPVTVVVRAAPTGAISANSAELNCTTGSVQLTASGTATFRWENGTTTSTRTVNQPGTYSVVLTDAFGCSTSINHVVFLNNAPPVVSILGNTSPICQGASVDLQAIPSTYNNAIRFDGNSQSADLGTWFNYPNFTIEFWAKAATIQSPFATIIDNNYSFTGLSWTCAQNNAALNQYSFTCYTPLGSASVPFTLTGNTWQHVALVKSGTAITVYINGSQVGTTPWTLGNIRYNGTESLRLGRWGGGTRFWNGQLDELRIFNSALPAAQILADMTANYPPVTANLVAYYKMDQPDNSPTVINSTTTAYGTGPLFGNPNFVVSGVAVSNSFTYLWTPGGTTLNSISVVPNGPITYLSRVTGNNGCPRVDSTELTVSLSSLGSIVATPSVCQGSTTGQVVFFAQGANPPYTFFYSVNGVNSTISTAANADSVILVPPTTTPGTLTYQLTNLVYANASFCLQAQFDSAVVTIRPNPTVTITSPAAVCAPNTVNLTGPAVTAGSAAGLTYSYWNSSSATTAVATPSAVDSAGTYYIQGTESVYGCSSIRPVTVMINPQPVIAALPDDTLCSGVPSTYALSSSLASTYSWTTTGATSGLGGAASGSGNSLSVNLTQPLGNPLGHVSYVITPTTTTTGCTGNADTVVFSVNAIPSITSVQDSSGCSTSSFYIGATASAGNVVWYSASTGGTALDTGTVFQTPVLPTTTTYYAMAVVDGCTSGIRVPVVATVENPGQWLGYTTNWDTPTNWGCRAVPTTTTDVTIPTTPVGGFYPTVSSNNMSVCRNLSLQNSASVTLTPGFDLGVYGDINNNGSSTFGGGTLRFNAAILQHFAAPSPQQVGTLHMNNSKVNNALQLLTDVSATEGILFTDGVIDLNGKTLTVGTATGNGSVTGAGAGNHINSLSGYFVRHTNSNSPYLFPLGDSTQYTPITLDFHSGAIGGGSIRSKMTPGKQPNLAATSYLNRYWTMEPSGLGGSIDYDAIYSYQNSADVVGTGTLFPVKYSTASGMAIWSSCPGSGIGNIDGSSGSHNVAAKTFSWYNVTAFSDFTGANTSLPLPIELLYFQAQAEQSAVRCDWVTMSETNNDYFTVERSADAMHFEPIGILAGAGTTSSRNEYSFIDDEPLEGISYYRLRQTDYDGTMSWSDIVAVRFKDNSALEVAYFTQDASSQWLLSFTSDTYLRAVEVFDFTGRLIARIPVEQSGQSWIFHGPAVAAGWYSIRIATTDKDFVRKCFLQE